MGHWVSPCLQNKPRICLRGASDNVAKQCLMVHSEKEEVFEQVSQCWQELGVYVYMGVDGLGRGLPITNVYSSHLYLIMYSFVYGMS
jgi:hypothetical protein